MKMQDKPAHDIVGQPALHQKAKIAIMFPNSYPSCVLRIILLLLLQITSQDSNREIYSRNISIRRPPDKCENKKKWMYEFYPQLQGLNFRHSNLYLESEKSVPIFGGQTRDWSPSSGLKSGSRQKSVPIFFDFLDFTVLQEVCQQRSREISG